MVATNVSVDIPELKARHPLGDTVEASGVRLSGRGRVRQGVCPFHEEAEGSFTVYADSERWYCFGLRSRRRRAGLHPARGEPDAARGDQAAGRRRLPHGHPYGTGRASEGRCPIPTARSGASDSGGAVLRDGQLRRRPGRT